MIPLNFLAVLATSILLAVLVIAFALPASRSGPHDVPIGVVGTPEQIVGFQTPVRQRPVAPAAVRPGAQSTNHSPAPPRPECTTQHQLAQDVPSRYRVGRQ